MTTNEQQNLFPVLGDLNEVQQVALSKLPITDPNELISILRLQQNTLLDLLEKTDARSTLSWNKPSTEALAAMQESAARH